MDNLLHLVFPAVIAAIYKNEAKIIRDTRFREKTEKNTCRIVLDLSQQCKRTSQANPAEKIAHSFIKSVSNLFHSIQIFLYNGFY